MTIEELERKPHSEWTKDEIIFWLSEYAREEIFQEIAYGSEE